MNKYLHKARGFRAACLTIGKLVLKFERYLKHIRIVHKVYKYAISLCLFQLEDILISNLSCL